jgi:hypothetical protein
MMTLPRRGAMRWLACAQAMLLLCMCMGSVCLRDGEAASLELGPCGCVIAASGCGDDPGIAENAGPECGPCRDEAILALPGSRSHTDASLATPVTAYSISGPSLQPCPGAGACLASATRPPRSSRTILRC